MGFTPGVKLLLGREDEDSPIVVEVFLRYREDARIEVSFCMDGVKRACICLYGLRDEFVDIKQCEHGNIMVQEKEVLVIQAWIAGETLATAAMVQE